MQKCWQNQNINLNLLAEKIAEFLDENAFKTSKNETEHGYYFLAKDSPFYEMDGQITIAVNGKPEAFTITVELQKKKPRPIGTMTTTLFTGGYFLGKQFNTEEAWIAFKRDFWQHIDIIVADLSDTISDTKQQPCQDTDT